MGEILGPWVKTLRSEPARSFPKTRGGKGLLTSYVFLFFTGKGMEEQEVRGLEGPQGRAVGSRTWTCMLPPKTVAIMVFKQLTPITAQALHI